MKATALWLNEIPVEEVEHGTSSDDRTLAEVMDVRLNETVEIKSKGSDEDIESVKSLSAISDSDEDQ
jgi:hypothetical protein